MWKTLKLRTEAEKNGADEITTKAIFACVLHH